MKRKYSSEDEVLDWINKYRAEISKIRIQAAETGLLADALRGTVESHRITGLRADVETMLNEIEWREGRLKTLGEILSEMRTLKMPFIEEIEEAPNPGKPSKWINEETEDSAKCSKCAKLFAKEEMVVDLSGNYFCDDCIET